MVDFTDILRGVTGALGTAFAPQTMSDIVRQESQNRQYKIDQISAGIQSGAIDPTAGNDALRKLGAMPTGQSAMTQERLQAAKDRIEADAREKQLRAGMTPILEQLQKGEITPEQARVQALTLQSQVGKAGEAVTALTKPQTKTVQDAQGNWVEIQMPTVGAPEAKKTGVKGVVKGGGMGSFWTAPSTLPQNTLRLLADQAKAGDTTWRQRLAPGDVRAVLEMLSKDKAEGKTSAEAILAAQTELKGLGAQERAMGTRAATVSMASNEALKMMDITLDKMKAVGPTDFIPANKAINAYNRNTGDPKIKAYGAALNSLVNAYSRAVSPTGAATVSDKEHARELLDAADSPEQVQAVIETMKQEMEAARAAPREARKQVREEISPPPSSTSGWSARIVK